MSTDFTFLCVKSPVAFLALVHPSLRWDERAGDGTFASMALHRRPLRPSDPLPFPDGVRIHCVLQASGRLDDDATFDAFYAWARDLVAATSGAVFDHQTGSFLFVSGEEDVAAPVDDGGEPRALLERRDYGALAAWIDQRFPPSERHDSASAWRDVTMLQALLHPEIGRAITEGDPTCIPALLAMCRVMQSHELVRDWHALVLAAANRPSLAATSAELRHVAARLAPSSSTAGERSALDKKVSEMQARHDAYHGPKRDRPRTPENVIKAIQKGRLDEASALYAKQLPEFAARAAEAVEDARRFFAPKVRPAATAEMPGSKDSTDKTSRS